MTNFNKKRYMVIERYPTSSDPIGNIVVEGDYGFDFAQYPNLYRLMAWWEHRSPENMPLYVEKISENDGYHVKGDFLKVEWLYNPENLKAVLPQQNKGVSKWVAKVGQHYYNASVLLPRTEDEYNKAPKDNKPSR